MLQEQKNQQPRTLYLDWWTAGVWGSICSPPPHTHILPERLETRIQVMTLHHEIFNMYLLRKYDTLTQPQSYQT